MRVEPLAHLLPPAADALHGKLCGVVIGADADPPEVVARVVDAVRDGFASVGIDKIVGFHLGRLALRSPFPAGVAVVADELFLLGVDGNRR